MRLRKKHAYVRIKIDVTNKSSQQENVPNSNNFIKVHGKKIIFLLNEVFSYFNMEISFFSASKNVFLSVTKHAFYLCCIKIQWSA